MQIMQEQLPVTLLVIRSFLILLGASRACVDFRDLTTFSRLTRSGGQRKLDR